MSENNMNVVRSHTTAQHRGHVQNMLSYEPQLRFNHNSLKSRIYISFNELPRTFLTSDAHEFSNMSYKWNSLL